MINKVIDKYDRAFESRQQKLLDFQEGERPFLVALTGPGNFYTKCNTIEDSFEANIQDFSDALDLPSDILPYLEPWFGTGLYASGFGCEYVWREDESPACHYKYNQIDEVAEINKPEKFDTGIFKMVTDAIEYFKERTNGRLPICVTDTQSAHDTATLVVNAVEVFTASYSVPDLLNDFLKKINETVIEFSKKQIELIGDCLSLPGHIMSFSTIGGFGFSISDDNLAVSSPQVNKDFLLPFDDEIGKALGGLALHSCGNWSHTMPMVAEMESIRMIDCAISKDVDPNPNEPEKVRDAFKGTDIIVQVRFGTEVEKELELLERIFDPELKLVARVSGVPEQAENQYNILNEFLKRKYGI